MLALPVLVAAFILQPDLTAGNLTQRTALVAAAVVAVVMLEIASDMRAVPRMILVTIALLAVFGTWQWVVADRPDDELANDRRCEAIQHDMLSARPKRADGPDLFQALGCKPRGAGSVYAPPPSAAKQKLY